MYDFSPDPWFSDVEEGDPDGLAWFQREAANAGLQALNAHRSCVIVGATGTGKTQIAAAIINAWLLSHPGTAVLFLAHRDELVNQARDRFEAMCGMYAGTEKADSRSEMKDRIVVGSVQSVTQPKRLERLGRDRFSLLIADECFPAGTMVDGRPIETIKCGEMVWSVDHTIGLMAYRRVTHVFKRFTAEPMIRLTIGATEVLCTPNHPVFVKGVGYVEAKGLVSGDVLCLRETVRVHDGVLLSAPKNMLEVLPIQLRSRNDGGDKSEVCVSADASQQPNAFCCDEGEATSHSDSDRPPPSGSGREWTADPRAATQVMGSLGRGVVIGVPHKHQDAEGERIPVLLQGGHRPSSANGSDRGRREQSQRFISEGAGQQEGHVLTWARLDRVESVEPGSSFGSPVYNLEVEGSHTYFANDVLVHNCHHFAAKTFKRVLDFFNCPRIGVTATPDRSDKIGIGSLFEVVAYNFGILEGIDAGYLCPVRARQVTIETIDLSTVSVSKGDLAIGELDEAMRKASEGILKAMLELEPARKAIIFTPGVRTAEYMAARLNSITPGCACFIHGGTPDWERRIMVQSFKVGHHQYLVNCQVATEGFDCPDASMVVIARPTMSRNLYAQMAGRACRAPAGVFAIHGKEGAAERIEFIRRSSKPDCVIFDPVGNTGKHSLVAPEDILGMGFTEKEKAHAKKLRAKGASADVRQLLCKAREELLKLARETEAAHVKYTSKEVDPFKVCGVDISDDIRFGTRFGVTPASERQLNALRNLGVKQPEGISKRAAKAMLDRLVQRRKQGLATLPQIGLLKKFGVDKPDLSKTRASEVIDYIIQSKQRGQRVDDARLAFMVNRVREPGEDG
jgi:superfamily II DNA or RNA helicase